MEPPATPPLTLEEASKALCEAMDGQTFLSTSWQVCLAFRAVVTGQLVTEAAPPIPDAVLEPSAEALPGWSVQAQKE